MKVNHRKPKPASATSASSNAAGVEIIKLRAANEKATARAAALTIENEALRHEIARLKAVPK